MGVEVALMAGMALAGGAASYTQAQQRNRAARRSIQSSREAASVQTRQVTAQAGQERENRIRQARLVQARALAAAGESGFSTDSGDVGAILGAIQTDTGTDLSNLATNRNNSLDYIQSQLEARIAEARGQQSNLLMSGFTGALGGLSTGLSLYNAGTQSSENLALKQQTNGLSDFQKSNVSGGMW